MISLIQYNEFGPGRSFPSMKDFFQESTYEGQDRIINYLRNNGKCSAAGPGTVHDVFTGEYVHIPLRHYNDGVYSWTSALIYYVEKYNLRLPKEFEEYVLKQ